MKIGGIFSFPQLARFRFFSWLHLSIANQKMHFFFALRSPCTNFHGVQVRLHLSSPNKKNAFFSLYCVRFALTFLRQVRLRFGIKNESFFDFHFVLRSPCTNFHGVQVRLRFGRANQKIAFFLCSSLTLH